MFCGGGGGGGIELSTVVSGSAGGGGGAVGSEAKAFSFLVPHSGQNFWSSLISAPQLLQNTIIFQIIACGR